MKRVDRRVGLGAAEVDAAERQFPARDGERCPFLGAAGNIEPPRTGGDDGDRAVLSRINIDGDAGVDHQRRRGENVGIDDNQIILPREGGGVDRVLQRLAGEVLQLNDIDRAVVGGQSQIAVPQADRLIVGGADAQKFARL